MIAIRRPAFLSTARTLAEEARQRKRSARFERILHIRMAELGRRGFLVGSGLLASCSTSPRGVATSREAQEVEPRASSAPVRGDEAPAPVPAAPIESVAEASKHVLFERYPALAKSLARIELGRFPSPVEHASAIDAWIKRDDDFTRSRSWQSTFAIARLFGGGKVRKLELFFGEARAQGKRRIVTSGGVGSNQALAVALLGKALGFEVRIHLAPMPISSLTKTNLAADAASHAEMRLFGSVHEAHARATADAKESGDTYVIPPGGTTPLGTLGFVNAGLEIAEDVRAGRMPAPRRIYVALGLGGTAAGLGIGCALGKLDAEIIAVRTSSPGSVSVATLKAIHDETIAFARARDATFEALAFANAKVRIDPRFVGGGYGVPTKSGTDAIARAKGEGWDLDPVYTGKAFAALLDDHAGGPLLFWNTASSRPVELAAVPATFERYAK